LSWRLGQIKDAVVGDWSLYKIDHYTVVFLSAMRNGSYPARRRPSGRYALRHAPLQADRDQLLCLDRELHLQMLQHILDDAVDNERGCLLRRHAALPASMSA
jgi:hypothetical protein